MLSECCSLKVDNNTVDLSIQRKVLLCAVLIVVFNILNQARTFVQEVGMCVRVCPPPRLLKAIYMK